MGGLLGYGAWNYFTVDACLDSGGAWFGNLGCLHDFPKVDRLVVDKSDHRLMAYSQGKVVQTFPVSIGRGAVGQKRNEGDNRTPEGVYPVVAHKPDSRFYRALRIGYPTAEQAMVARKHDLDPGGDIMIHGLPKGLGWIGRLQRSLDWTRGCVAVTNGEINWLYQAVPDGTPVEIRA
jgi:murein L,D-transpeptidase YafK